MKKRYKFLFLLMFVLGFSNLKSQPASFLKIYGNHSAFLFPTTVCEALDGGFVLATSREPTGGFADDEIIRTDSLGTPVWIKNIPYVGEPKSLKSLPDGGFVMMTDTEIVGGFDYPIIMKFDANGNYVWSFNQGYLWSDNAGLVSYSDGSIIFCGSSGNACYIGKLSASGHLIWEHQFNTLSQVLARDFKLINNSFFAITGTTYSTSNFKRKIFLSRVDTLGNLIDTHFSGDYYWQDGTCVSYGGNNEILITGYARDSIYHGDFMVLIKTDMSGNEIWNKNYFHVQSDYVSAYPESCFKSLDGNYFVSGSFEDSLWHKNVLCIQLDTAGNIFNNIQYDNTSWSQGWWDAFQDNEGMYIVAGVWHHLTGGGTWPGESSQLFLLRTNMGEVVPVTTDVTDITENKTVNIFPNPATNNFEIRMKENGVTFENNFKLFNSLGQIVIENNFYSDAIIDISKLESGIYFYEISNSHERQINGKLVKQ